jgi:hypothetical protein
MYALVREEFRMDYPDMPMMFSVFFLFFCF